LFYSSEIVGWMIMGTVLTRKDANSRTATYGGSRGNEDIMGCGSKYILIDTQSRVVQILHKMGRLRPLC
jgi:hypothetical protein